jgi:hypothetical protein
MRGRNDGGQSKRPIVLFWAMVVSLCFLFLYFSGSNGQTRSAAIEYGTKFSRSLGWGSDTDGDDGPEESIFGTGDANDVKSRSFPVSSESLITCLLIVFICVYNCQRVIFPLVHRYVMISILS